MKYAQSFKKIIPWWAYLLYFLPSIRAKYFGSVEISKISVPIRKTNSHDYKVCELTKFAVWKEKPNRPSGYNNDPDFLNKHCEFIGHGPGIEVEPNIRYWIEADIS